MGQQAVPQRQGRREQACRLPLGTTRQAFGGLPLSIGIRGLSMGYGSPSCAPLHVSIGHASQWGMLHRDQSNIGNGKFKIGQAYFCGLRVRCRFRNGSQHAPPFSQDMPFCAKFQQSSLFHVGPQGTTVVAAEPRPNPGFHNVHRQRMKLHFSPDPICLSFASAEQNQTLERVRGITRRGALHDEARSLTWPQEKLSSAACSCNLQSASSCSSKCRQVSRRLDYQFLLSISGLSLNRGSKYSFDSTQQMNTGASPNLRILSSRKAQNELSLTHNSNHRSIIDLTFVLPNGAVPDWLHTVVHRLSSICTRTDLPVPWEQGWPAFFFVVYHGTNVCMRASGPCESVLPLKLHARRFSGHSAPQNTSGTICSHQFCANGTLCATCLRRNCAFFYLPVWVVLFSSFTKPFGCWPKK